LSGNCRASLKPRRSRPPGVPIAIEGQDLAAIVAGKILIDGIDLETPDGGVLDVGVFFFQQQEVKAQGGKKGCEGVFQALPQPLSLPIIRGCSSNTTPRSRSLSGLPSTASSRSRAGPNSFWDPRK
jgi:hypothetical protein